MKKDENYVSSTVSYIKRNLRKGYDKESLRWMLIKQGNSRTEVEKAFSQAEKEIANEQLMERRRQEAIQPAPRIETIIPEVEKKKGFFARFFGK